LPAKTYLVLLKPLFQQWLLALLNDWPSQLQRLVSVQIPLLQQNTKVLQDRRQCPRGIRSLFERLDSLLSPENTSGRVGGDLGGFRVLAVLDVGRVLLLDDVVGSRQTGSGGELDGEFGVVQGFYLSARRPKKSGEASSRVTYPTIASSSTATLRTCPFLLTPIIPLNSSYSAVVKIVSPEIRFM
jgi:hypothetical protein